jgi:hypothetical protein
METNETICEVKTTEKYWDCECKDKFIHPKTQSQCNICGALAEEQPDSRINEILMQGLSL